MKVLVYRYGSICEPDIISSLKKAGIEVLEEIREINDKHILPSDRAKLVANYLENNSLLFVFSINFFPGIADVCNIYKVPYLFWTVDSPVLELFHPSLKHESNRGFLFDRAQFVAINSLGLKNIYHLPLAAASDRFDRVIDGITSEDISRYSADISFVGSLYTEYDRVEKMEGLSEKSRGYIDGISNVAWKIYGSYIVPSVLSADVVNEIKSNSSLKIPDSMVELYSYIASHYYISNHIAAIERTSTLNALAACYSVELYTGSDTSNLKNVRSHGKCDSLTEMPKIFNLSKINLNMTLRSIEKGLPLRCFDIMGCGGFLMTNYQEEIVDMFEIGVDLEAYSSIEELIDKCGYYLEHEDIRKKIAINGYKKVKNNYTYFHRLREMLKSVV